MTVLLPVGKPGVRPVMYVCQLLSGYPNQPRGNFDTMSTSEVEVIFGTLEDLDILKHSSREMLF